MARPSFTDITNGSAAWDADVNDNFSLVGDTPLPLATYANAAALPTASAYEDCLAVTEDTDLLYISDGSSWNLVGGGGTFLLLTDTPSSYSGEGGKFVKVNVGETALEFVSHTLVTTFLGLSDTPSSYSGSGGYVVKVNSGATALEFVADSNSLSVYSKIMGRFLSIDSTEADTGMRWTSNEQIYCKYVDMGTLQNAGTDIQAHGITNLGDVIEAWGVIAEDNFEVNDDYEAANSMHNLSGTGGQALFFDATNARLRTDWDASGYYGRVYMLYTKSSGGGTTETEGCITHSTSEQNTGWNWIDGRKIYVKTVSTGGFPNATSSSTAHGITDLNEVIYLHCTGKTASDTQMTLPRSYSTESTDISVGSTNIVIETTTDRSTYTSSFTTLYYTKDENDAGLGETRGPDFSVLEERYAGYTQGSKRVYFKVIDCGALPNATSSTVAHGIRNLGKVVHLFGSTYDGTTALSWYKMPLIIDNSGSEDGCSVVVNRQDITLTTSADMTRFETTYLVIFYTKEYEDLEGAEFAFSEDEYATGNLWIDGSMIYRKTIDFGAMPDTTTKSVNHNISSLDPDKIIAAYGSTSNGSTMFPLPRVATALNENIMVWVTATQVNCACGSDLSGYDQGYITIEYTK
jgi:hypothetical protein